MGQIIQTSGLVEQSTAGYGGVGALAWTHMQNNRFPGQVTDQGFEVDPLGNLFHLLDIGGSEDAFRRNYQNTTGRLLSVQSTTGQTNALPVMSAGYDSAGNQTLEPRAPSQRAPSTMARPRRGSSSPMWRTVYDGLGHERFLHERTAGDSGIVLRPERRQHRHGNAVRCARTAGVGPDVAPGGLELHEPLAPECTVQRFIWNGSALVGEIRMPLDTLAKNDTGVVFDSEIVEQFDHEPAQDTNYSWTWGAVLYFHGAGEEGIDVPVAAMRVGGGQPWDLDSTYVSILFPPFPIYVHTDWRGKIAAMSFTGGGPNFNGNPRPHPPEPTGAKTPSTPFGHRNAARLSLGWVDRSW